MEQIIQTFKEAYTNREINQGKINQIIFLFMKNKFGCLSSLKKCFLQIMNSIHSLKLFPKQNLEIFEILFKKLLSKINKKLNKESDEFWNENSIASKRKKIYKKINQY